MLRIEVGSHATPSYFPKNAHDTSSTALIVRGIHPASPKYAHLIVSSACLQSMMYHQSDHNTSVSSPHLHVKIRKDLPHPIIVPPLLCVAQDIVRLVNLRHLSCSLGPIFVSCTIGMVLQAQCAVRLLDVVCGCGTRDTEDFVETRLGPLICDEIWSRLRRGAVRATRVKVKVGRGIVRVEWDIFPKTGWPAMMASWAIVMAGWVIVLTGLGVARGGRFVLA
jgi:hypothetical protein